MKTKIIVNPAANKGNCGRRWPQIRVELEKRLGTLANDVVALTRSPNDASQLAARAVRAGCRRLIAVGGDGTFSEVLNGIIQENQLLASDLVLAQIPAGTSNELCRSFRQHSIPVACQAIASGHTRNIDVFRATAMRPGAGQTARYGCVLAIAGAPATISWRAQRLPLLKRLGPISYVIVTAIVALTYRPRAYSVQIDDEPEQHLNVWGLLLCSFDGAGERLMLAPRADPGDGKLDLIIVGDLSRREILTQVVPKLGDGSYLAHPRISRRHAHRVAITSDREVRVDVDGESIGTMPMSVELLPFRVSVAASELS